MLLGLARRPEVKAPGDCRSLTGFEPHGHQINHLRERGKRTASGLALGGGGPCKEWVVGK